MRAGAHDYLRKDNISRLPLVIEHEMQQAAIRQQNRQLEAALRIHIAALNSAANSIVITDLNGTIQWVNAAFTKLTGYSAAEAIGKNPRVLKSGKHDHQFYRRHMEDDHFRLGMAWRNYQSPQGRDLYVEEMTITPVRSEDSSILTSLPSRKTSLRVNRPKNLAPPSLPDRPRPRRCHRLRMDGTITSWNRGAEALYGWSKEQAIGKPAHALFRQNSRKDWSTTYQQLRRTGSWSGELVHHTKADMRSSPSADGMLSSMPRERSRRSSNPTPTYPSASTRNSPSSAARNSHRSAAWPPPSPMR